jgi:hypothetical protein
MTDYKKWIEEIVVEIAKISTMKQEFSMIEAILKESNNKYKWFLINRSYSNFVYAHTTRLTRIIEPYKEKRKDDKSLSTFLEKYKNHIDDESIKKRITEIIIILKNCHSDLKNFRDKEIAHLTFPSENSTWSISDKILEIIQQKTNEILNLVTGNTILASDWNVAFVLNEYCPFPMELGYHDGKWMYSA